MSEALLLKMRLATAETCFFVLGIEMIESLR